MGRAGEEDAMGVDKPSLAFCWGVSSFYGWGVYGMNLALHAADRYALQCAVPFGPDDIYLDPVREARIAALAKASAPLWEKMRGGTVDLPHMVLEGLGHELVGAGRVTGTPSVGVVFLEQAKLSDDARKRADAYARIIAGSSWNERILRDQGVSRVTTILQGVDTSLFHPAPKARLFPGRFVIFSGGKLEFRKGQDIVLAAFRAFHQRHPEALLLCAWHSPWGKLAAQIGCPLKPDNSPDVNRWVIESGLPADAVVSVPATPNAMMPQIIREADVALFPNRCEGGTNLPAMECMACGVPTIVSSNTGHLDLIRTKAVFPLEWQRAVTSSLLDTTDWGESSVDECVETLETVFERKAEYMSTRAAFAMKELTWAAQIMRLMEAIEGISR